MAGTSIQVVHDKQTCVTRVRHWCICNQETFFPEVSWLPAHLEALSPHIDQEMGFPHPGTLTASEESFCGPAPLALGRKRPGLVAWQPRPSKGKALSEGSFRLLSPAVVLRMVGPEVWTED